MEQKTTANFPHNLVTYVEPTNLPYQTMDDLVSNESEKALAENAIWFFLNNESWDERDRIRLQKLWERRGWNMFTWKYYRASRCFLGGYKALSATLYLRKL